MQVVHRNWHTRDASFIYLQLIDDKPRRILGDVNTVNS